MLRPTSAPPLTAVQCVVIMLLAGCNAGDGDRNETRLATEVATRLDDLLRRVTEDYGLVGTQAALYRDGQVIFTSALGYADLEHLVPMTDTTRLPIASVMKAVTGYALLTLQSNGRVDLDAPVQRYVPQFPDKRRLVTTRLLAESKSGIRHYGDERTPAFYTKHYANIADALELFGADPLIGEQGDFNYSSYGFNLLAAAIQNASGVAFQDYIGTRVLVPMGMTRTTFDDARRILAGRSRMYSYYPVMPRGRTADTALYRVPDTWDFSYNAGGGGLVSTSADLARFGGRFADAGEASPVWDFYRGGDGGFYFGWWGGTADGHLTIRAQGGYIGTFADVRIYPDRDLVVSFMTNTGAPGNLIPLTHVMGRVVLDGLADPFGQLQSAGGN